jgi:hypothetical protein
MGAGRRIIGVRIKCGSRYCRQCELLKWVGEMPVCPLVREPLRESSGWGPERHEKCIQMECDLDALAADAEDWARMNMSIKGRKFLELIVSKTSRIKLSEVKRLAQRILDGD